MTTIERLEYVENRAAEMQAQIIRMGGTPPVDNRIGAINFKTKTPVPVTTATTSAPKAPPAPQTLLEQYNAMGEGPAKKAFQKTHWIALVRAQEAARNAAAKQQAIKPVTK